MLTGTPASASVTAVVDAELWALHQSDFVSLLATCPSFARNIAIILSRRLSVTNKGPNQHLARFMCLRVHPSTPPGLPEDVARMVAKHIGKPLLVLDTRAGTRWRPDERRGELATEIAGGELLEKLRATQAASLLVLAGNDISIEAWARFEIRVVDHLTHLLVITDGAVRPDFLGSVGEIAVEVTLVAASEQRQPSSMQDVALIGEGEQRNSRSALERAGNDRRTNVVRFVATGSQRTDEDIAWFARHLAGMKVGLALGAGGIRGFAHVGVLLALRQNNVPIDYIVGCSAGGLIAAAYAAGPTPEAMLSDIEDFSARMMRFTISRRSLLSARGLEHMYRDRMFADRLIEDTNIPLAVVAVDVFNHVEVVLEHGLLRRAVLATTALPGVYPPVRIHDRWLVDGGLLDPVPAPMARGLGADIVFGVNLGGLRDQSPLSVTADDIPGRNKSPHAVDILLRSFDIMGNRMSVRGLQDADVALVANIEPLGFRDFHRVPQLVKAGERAVGAARRQIQAVLPWMRDA